MPMAERDRNLPVNPRLSPPGTAQLVSISVIAILHHVINQRTAATLVVIIRLPHAAIGLDCQLIGTAEIMTTYLQFTSPGITPKVHPWPVSLPPSITSPTSPPRKHH